jgi:hypothetical protein
MPKNPELGRSDNLSNTVIITDNESEFSLLRKNNANLFATTPVSDNIYFNESYTQNCAILIDAKHSGL